jgi:molybdopterin-guanine dinucleotide biosynthesis protein A
LSAEKLSPGGAGVAGYVLAGGQSSRFGSDKALAELGGKPMLLRMAELAEKATGSIALVAPLGRYEYFGYREVEDRWPGAGPLGGIATALLDAAVTSPAAAWALILGCDLPYLTEEWLANLTQAAQKSGAQAVVPRSAEGMEPLCACYRADSGPAIQAMLDGGLRKITAALENLKTEVLDEALWKRFDSAGRLFRNMNSFADYTAIRAEWREAKH